MVVNLIIFLQIKSSTGYLEKYSKILNVLFDFFKKIQMFFDRTSSLFVSVKYWYQKNLSTVSGIK